MIKTCVVKTVDGNEIIGRIDEDKTDLITIEDPLEIRYRHNADTGAYTAVLVKYMYFSREEVVRILPQAVICIYEVNEETVKTYESTLESLKKATKDEDISAMKKGVMTLIERFTSNSTIH